MIDPDEPRRRSRWLPLAAAGMAAATIAAIVLIPRSADDAQIAPVDTDTAAPAPSVVVTVPDAPGSTTATSTVTTTVTSTVTTTVTTTATASSAPDGTLPESADPPPTTTAARTVLAAVSTDGDAVLVPADGSAPITLFDGPDPVEADEGTGPNAVDAVALSPDGRTAWVGFCCEPIAGAVLRGSPAGVTTDGSAPPEFGYAPAVSPDGRLLAIGSIAGPALVLTDLTTGDRLDAPDFGDEVGAFTPYDTVWLDERRVVGIGISSDEEGTGWVAVPMVVDGATVTVGETLLLDEALTLAGDSIVRGAGVIDGDRFAVHVDGRSAGDAIEFRLDGVTRASAPSVDPDRELVPGDVGEPARSIWYRPAAPIVWVGTDGVAHLGDEVLPGSWLWVRPTDATEIAATPGEPAT